MKNLFEGWKRFIAEDKMNDKQKQEYLKTLGLYVGKTDGEYNVYIYEWSTERVKAGWPMIVGTLGTMQMDNKGRTPCIPETQEIGTSAVKEERQSRGIGSHMYEVVAYYMKMEQGGGITSDHSASTTNDAANIWKKLKNKLNYIKRKTPKGPDKETFNSKTGEILPAYKGGNDKFDYDKSTPDPNDDCYEPSDGKSPAPHSLQIPPGRMQYVAKLMEIQLDNFDNMMSRAKEFDAMDIPSDGSMLFNREYDPYKSGVHGDEAQPGISKPQRQQPVDIVNQWRQYLEEDQLDEKMMLRKHKQGWYLYAQLVAEAYKTAPDMSSGLKADYEILGKWLEGEFRRLSSRIQFKFVPEHPYKSAAELRQRVADEGIMYVSTSDATHPVWTGKQGLIWNTMFRAYHDYEGHMAKKKNFNLRHEIGAYNAHAKRVPQECIPILFTEVVGQICCFYNSGMGNCPQKATILDDFDFINVGALSKKGEKRLGYTLDEKSKLLIPIGSKIGVDVEEK